MKTILLMTQKGGVGKTTLAGEIIRSIQRSGIPSAFYDLDGQGDGIVKPYKDADAKVAVIDSPGQLQEHMGEWVEDADVIVIPTRSGVTDIKPLMRTLEIVKANKRPRAKIVIILNQYTHWTSSKEFMEWISKQQKSGVTILTVPQSDVIIQAGTREKSVVDYRPRSDAAAAMLETVNAVRKAAGLKEEEL